MAALPLDHSASGLPVSARARPLRQVATATRRQTRTRWAIAIPAHNEETVIGRTVAGLRQMDYPADLYAIHVVADHCSDETAEVAQAAGAVAHERADGPRGGKGQALRWLFARLLDGDGHDNAAAYDAVVVFDADTQVDAGFLKAMDACLAQGATAIQGQHRISNPGRWLVPCANVGHVFGGQPLPEPGPLKLGVVGEEHGRSGSVSMPMCYDGSAGARA
ncbi:MAG: glycosyltransferase family 2 protein [Anaerolineae bacterium]